MSRKKSTPLEEIILLVSLIPWWVNLLLAVLSYCILNYISHIEIQSQPVGNVEEMVEGVYNQAFQRGFIFFAGFIKVIPPIVFIIGAIISAITQKKRGDLLESVVHDDSGNATGRGDFRRKNPIDEMSWQQFEILVSAFFRKQGYSVTECGGSGPDGGVDLRLKKNGKKVIVQCKHWKVFKVGVRIVREQLGIKVAEKADFAIIITSGFFTDEAKRFARGQGITLVDGNQLKSIITQGKQFLSSEAQNFPNKKVAPPCPKCSSIMVERIAKRGKWAGRSFWGCTRFPQCKGIVPK